MRFASIERPFSGLDVWHSKVETSGAVRTFTNADQDRNEAYSSMLEFCDRLHLPDVGAFEPVASIPELDEENFDQLACFARHSAAVRRALDSIDSAFEQLRSADWILVREIGSRDAVIRRVGIGPGGLFAFVPSSDEWTPAIDIATVQARHLADAIHVDRTAVNSVVVRGESHDAPWFWRSETGGGAIVVGDALLGRWLAAVPHVLPERALGELAARLW